MASRILLRVQARLRLSHLNCFTDCSTAPRESGGVCLATAAVSPLGSLEMKKVCACLVLGLVMIGLSIQSASALPPFSKEWTAKYNSDERNTAYVEAKCNVCHEGTSKKMKNEYGKAV